MRLQKLSDFLKYKFVRNVAILQIGSFAGTVFQALIGVFLARMLQPELFGTYSLVFGLAGIGGLFLGAGIQEATSTLLGSAYARQNKEEVKDILAFLLKITSYAGLATLIIMLFMPLIADQFYQDSTVGQYANIMLAGVFLSGFFTAVVGLSLQVTGKIKELTLMVFGDQFFRFGIALFLVFIGFGVWGAVSAQFLGALIMMIIALGVWGKLVKDNNILPGFFELFSHMRRVSIKKYLNFSLWVAVDRNMGNLYMALPVALVGIYVSVGEVSFFKLAFGFVNIALSLLGPVSTLLNTEFSRIQVENPSKLYGHFIKVSLYGVIISFLLTLGALVAAPIAFRVLYGESFMPSVNYVFGLFFYGAVFGIGVGLGPMWRAVNKVKISIYINLLILGGGIPLGLILIKQFGIWGGVAMVTFWFTASHLISFIYLLRSLRKLYDKAGE